MSQVEEKVSIQSLADQLVDAWKEKIEWPATGWGDQPLGKDTPVLNVIVEFDETLFRQMSVGFYAMVIYDLQHDGQQCIAGASIDSYISDLAREDMIGLSAYHLRMTAKEIEKRIRGLFPL